MNFPLPHWKNHCHFSHTVQSFGRDFGSPSETDYVVLLQTKARARELMIKWIFDAIDEDKTDPPAVPLNEASIAYQA